MSVPTVRLSSPADVLAAMPHLLGFEPHDDLVLVCMQPLGDKTCVGMVARVDLPGVGEVADVAESLLPPVLRQEPSGVLLIGYGAEPDATVAVEVVGEVLAVHGLAVTDRLVVTEGEWRSLTPSMIEGDATMGGRVPGRDSVTHLEFAIIGSTPAASRETLERQCQEGPRASAVGRECSRLLGSVGEVTVERGVAAWGRLLDVRDRLPLAEAADETIALAAVALHTDGEPVLRDTLVAWIAPSAMTAIGLDEAAAAGLREHLPLPWWADAPDLDSEGPARSYVLARMMEVSACVPDAYAAPVLTVLGHVAWCQGSGAVARVAVARALAADPTYRLARLLDRMLDLGIRPPV